MTRAIPYVAKRPNGLTPWRAFGCDAKTYALWVPHVCAIACARSLILAKRGVAPSLWDLTSQGIALGLFIVADEEIKGAFHDPLVRLLDRFGIDAYRFGKLCGNALASAVTAGPVILSVDLARLDRGYSGSHLVLVTARSGDNYLVHDNAAVIQTDGANCMVSAKHLDKWSNGKGVAVVGWNRTSSRP